MKDIQGIIKCTDRIAPKSKAVLSAFSSSLLPNRNYIALLGFCDVHVHFREPGFSYKGTVKTGSLAAAAGGYTTVFTMPNLNPTPDDVESIGEQIRIIERDAIIEVLPYGTITRGQRGEELSDMEALSPMAIAFSDDGRGVQSEDMMRAAMSEAKRLGKIIVAHCEDNSLLHGGYIHDGEYAERHGHRGICSESEFLPIARDLKLVEEIGCKYHVCHISTKESVALIREAKARGLDVTCETAPHYLILNDGDLKEQGRYKMNPPIRSEEDRLALIEGIVDGTIDMIATDHAPHSREEKDRGLEKSAFGVVGLETAFSSLYTHLVKPGVITIERLEELMAISPRERFGLPIPEDDFCLFDLDKEYTVRGEDFKSMGKATPFEGMKLCGKNLMTCHRGVVVYNEL